MTDHPKPPAPAEPKHGETPDKPFQPLPPNTPLPPDIQAEKEVGGRNGPEPTRYGDWEKGGIAVDF